MSRPLGVAEAKRRFSELLDRVASGEQIVIARRGRPAVVLVAPDAAPASVSRAAPAGFASIAGSLAAWPELDGAFDDLAAARARAKDRPPPDLG